MIGNVRKIVRQRQAGDAKKVRDGQVSLLTIGGDGSLFLLLLFERFRLLALLLLYLLLPLQLIRELLIDLASEFGQYTFFCHGGVNSFLLFVYETPRRADIAARNTVIRENPRETHPWVQVCSCCAFNLCTGGDG